jgi:hypothetical protein
MITAAQIEFLLSAPQATAGYTAVGTPGNSLGLYCSTSQLSTSSGGLDNLFTDWSGAMNAADQTDYACVFIWNTNTTNTMLTPVAWLPTSLLGSGNQAIFQIAADLTPPTVIGSSPAQAVAISSPIISPSGLTWYNASTTSAGGAPLSNIPPNYCAAVWIKRTANGVPATNSFNIDVTFDSLA